MQVAQLAAERIDCGVVALGIGGSEERGPAEWFTEVYAFAKSAGLRLTPMPAKATGPESIWAALQLGAERIGHGIAAVRDPDLMRHLREHDIPLEICITSNLVTGVVTRLEDHPVRRLYRCRRAHRAQYRRSGHVPCTLAGEYRLAARAFGFTQGELRGIAANGSGIDSSIQGAISSLPRRVAPSGLPQQ